MTLLGTPSYLCVFFFNDTATTEIYTLSLHDALPISCSHPQAWAAICRGDHVPAAPGFSRSSIGICSSNVWNSREACTQREDRKSTRLNSSHANISYAVFCLKKKKTNSKTRGYMIHQY